MMKQTLLTNLILLALLIGCSGRQVLDTKVSPEAITTSTSPSTAESKPTSPETTVDTPTVSPTHAEENGDTLNVSITNAFSGAQLTANCLDITNLPSSNDFAEGSVILENLASTNGHPNLETWLQNLRTGEKALLTKQNENFEYLTSSPSNETFAYERIKFEESSRIIIDEDLVIANSNGEPQIVVQSEEGWCGIADWLDNDQLIINVACLGGKESRGEMPATLLALNPFTGDKHILTPDFPGIYDIYPVPNWNTSGVTVYDPALSKVVYLQGGIGETGSYVIWDLQDSRELARLEFEVYDLASVPRWSHDGEYVYFELNSLANKKPTHEFFRLDLMGNIEQLSDISGHYPWTHIGPFSLSPNDQLIAFWLTTWEDKPDFLYHGNQELAVLDTSTGKVTNYCIPGDFESPLNRFIPAPLWSPSGQQLMVLNRHSEHSYRVIQVDIYRGKASQLIEDMLPEVWLK